MSSKERPILGVDIASNEIRVIEMSGRWSQPQILSIGAEPLPPGAVENGLIIDPQMIADALRGLLLRIGARSREAIVGIASLSVIARLLDIPNAPDEEIPAILQGELMHYHLLREGQGALDYMRLDPGAQAASSRISVLLMAAESRIVSLYREIAERAGLRLIAIEPILLALFRTAFPQFHAGPSVCLAVSTTKTEIVIADQGVIRLYRRLDLGANDLIHRRKARLSFSEAPQTFMDLSNPDTPPQKDLPDVNLSYVEMPPRTAPLPDPISWVDDSSLGMMLKEFGLFDAGSLTSLIVEVQRSLDYFRRTFPAAGPVEQLVVATNETELERLAEACMQGLYINTVIATPLAAAGEAELTSGSARLRFLGAAGLAMHALPDHPDTVPRFDLSAEERENVLVDTTRRKMTVSLAAAAAVMVLGLGLAYLLGARAIEVDGKLFHAREELVNKQSQLQEQDVALQTQKDRLVALQSKDVPLARIMDSVTEATAPDASLTEVWLDPTGRLQLSGEAVNERAIISTVNRLRTSPFFTNPSLDSFSSDPSASSRPSPMKFEVSTLLAGLPPHPAADAQGGTR